MKANHSCLVDFKILKRNRKRMQPNYYYLIDLCVEKGIEYGYFKAFKHTDTPSEQQIKENIHHAIMNEICEFFNFESNTNS